LLILIPLPPKNAGSTTEKRKIKGASTQFFLIFLCIVAAINNSRLRPLRGELINTRNNAVDPADGKALRALI